MRQTIPKWIASQLPEGTDSHFFSSTIGQLHYLSRGQGRQVVMVHGNPTWSFVWRRVMANLDPSQFEFLAPDLMNLGFSADLSNPNFSIDNHVKYMTEFFKAKVRKDAILVVQDWGGPIGLLAAQKLPGLFGGYVILNTGVAAPKMPVRLSWFHKLSNTPFLAEFLFGVCGFPMYSLHKVQFDPKSICGNVAKAYRFPIDLTRRTSALKYARMVPSSENHTSLSRFSDLEEFCRALQNVEVVWGVKDPILGRQIKRVKEVLKLANFTEVDAGHFLQEEAFNEIAASITRLSKLKSVE